MKKNQTDIDVKKTGENIKLLMNEKQVSCNKVAVSIDVTENAISNYRNGYNLPDTEHLYKLCKYFDKDIKDIIVEKEKNKDE